MLKQVVCGLQTHLCLHKPDDLQRLSGYDEAAGRLCPVSLWRPMDEARKEKVGGGMRRKGALSRFLYTREAASISRVVPLRISEGNYR